MKSKAVRMAQTGDPSSDGAGPRKVQPAMKFVIFKEANGRWYWDLRDLDGQPVAKCAMGFAEQAQAFRSVETVRSSASRSLVFDPLGNLASIG
jgi:uncharacterized protein YegP (UPF0339 family)